MGSHGETGRFPSTRARALLCALAAAMLPCLLGADTPDSGDRRWWIALQLSAGIPEGQVRVGEPSPSTPLNLSDDLGIDFASGLRASTFGWLSAKDRLAFSAESIFMQGSKTFDGTVTFDEGSFPAGSSPKADPRFYLLEAEYAHAFTEPASRNRWSLLAGIDYAYLDFRIGDQSEDFYRQEVPMPVVGAEWSRRLGEHSSLRVDGRGFRFNHLDTHEVEGSTVYLDQTLVDARAGWEWEVTPRFRWGAGYRFFYFSQTENSSEDFNDFHMRLNSITLTFALRL